MPSTTAWEASRLLDRLTSAEASIREIEAALNVEWPDPAYREMETTSEDTAAGTRNLPPLPMESVLMLPDS